MSIELETVRGRVQRALVLAGRAPDSAMLLAVSKQHGVDAIKAAYECGQRDFAESYVQEAVPKIRALKDLKIEWHFIGCIQSNKTKAIAENFQWVHSVDRAKVAIRLNEHRQPSAPPLNVLIQVDQGGELDAASKSSSHVLALATTIAALPRLKLRGLMCKPAATNTPAQNAAVFRELAELGKQLNASGIGADSLSMGMSADFEIAIANGATCVRVGSAIFGRRLGGAGAH